MAPEWIGAISALGGVAIGALAETVRARFSFRRDKRWEFIDERRRRLESVYESLELVSQAYTLNSMPVLAGIMSGRRPNYREDAPSVPWAHLKMLVNLYCPSLVPELRLVESAGPALGAAVADGIMTYTGDPLRDRSLAENITAKQDEFWAAINNMRDAIVEQSRDLDKETVKLIGNRDSA